MDLYDSLFDPESTADFGIHALEAAIVEYATGNATRAQIATVLGMDPEAVSDLDTLLDALDALPSTVEKLVFMQEMQAVNIGHEEEWPGYQTKAQYVNRLGL
jgi:hypothetical protein